MKPNNDILYNSVKEIMITTIIIATLFILAILFCSNFRECNTNEGISVAESLGISESSVEERISDVKSLNLSTLCGDDGLYIQYVSNGYVLNLECYAIKGEDKK